MKMINVKDEGYILDVDGSMRSYSSDHEVSEVNLLPGLASAIRQMESLKKVEENMRRLLGIK